jgi:hypothetical protein
MYSHAPACDWFGGKADGKQYVALEQGVVLDSNAMVLHALAYTSML